MQTTINAVNPKAQINPDEFNLEFKTDSGTPIKYYETTALALCGAFTSQWD